MQRHLNTNLILTLAFLLFTPAFLTTNAFAQDPTLTIDRIEGNSGGIIIHYTATDPKGQLLATTNWEYSIDGGNTWLPTYVIAGNEPKPPGSSSILADTTRMTGLQGESIPSVLFRMQVTDLGSWRSVAPMPTARSGLSVVVVDERIYAIGGIGGVVTVEVYNPITDIWQSRAEAPNGRIGFATAVAGGKVYVFGSGNSIVDVYDPETDTWESRAKALYGGFIAAVVAGGKIYAVDNENTLSVYNPTQDTWTGQVRPPQRSSSTTAVTLNGNIYAVGGRLWRYNPQTNIWQERATMRFVAGHFAATVTDGKIHAIGGQNRRSAVYDPQSDRWSRTADLPTARKELAAGTVAGKIYAIGGESVDGNRLSTVEEFTPPRYSEFAQSDSFAVTNSIAALIISPIMNSHHSGILQIRGTARSDAFQSWVLDYAHGENPVTGHLPIEFSNQPVGADKLADWDTTAHPDGTYTLRLRVTDTNAVTVKTSVIITVDNTPPPIPVVGINTVDGEGNFTRSNGAIAVAGTSEAYSSVVSAKLVDGEGQEIADVTKYLQIDIAGGIHGEIPGHELNNIATVKLLLTIADRAGNEATSASNTLAVDNDLPVIQILSPAEGSNFNAGTILVIGNTSDAFSGIVRVEVNGGFGWKLATGTSNWTFDFTPPTPDIQLSLQAKAFDKAGNVATTAITVSYLTALPTANLSEPMDGAQLTGSVVVSGTAEDTDNNPEDLRWTLEYAPGANADNGWTEIANIGGQPVRGDRLAVWDVSALPDGAYTLRLTVSNDQISTSVKRRNLFKSPAQPDNPRPPNTPINVEPSDGAIGTGMAVTLKSASFSDPNPTDTHVASQWQVTTSADDYNRSIYDSGRDSGNLTVLVLPQDTLSENQTYYWRARHQDSSEAWSEYSVETHFDTSLPPPNVVGQFTLSLETGLNFISLPVKPETPLTVAVLARQLDATLILRFDAKAQEFISFVPGVLTGDDFPISGGEGYIVNVLQPKEITFTGTVWDNANAAPALTSPPAQPLPQPLSYEERGENLQGGREAAPPSLVGKGAEPVPIYREGLGTVWAFVIVGEFTSTDGAPILVTATNERTGQTTSHRLRGDAFTLAYVDLSRKAVVEAGDTIHVRVLDDRGIDVSEPLRVRIEPGDLARAFTVVRLQPRVIPEQTRLLQNYPNPFNPETWIPYDLATNAHVVMEIFDVSGRLVRRLELGYQTAGSYQTRVRAAYWDGRDERGERVASELYFVQMKAGAFVQTRRLVVLK